MLSDENIYQRYLSKQHEFEKAADVTLIGHSLFDMWDDEPQGTPLLAGQTVANMGISGVSARQYLDVIVKPQRITALGKYIFIFLGVNDIVKEPDYSPKQVLAWIVDIQRRLQKITPHSRYFLLEATPINPQCVTVDNPTIDCLNQYLQANVPSDLNFIATKSAFVDENGALAQDLTRDGLHFTAKGYAVLQQLLEQQLSH